MLRLTRRRFFIAASVSGLVATLFAVNGCSTTYPRRNPSGEMFPSVAGETLDGKPARLPDDFAGRPVLLLVGYEQDTQFDLDRWLLGLQQAGVAVDVREVPIIPGMIPRMFSGVIDNGMRGGIPNEDWGSVITVYGDAKKIAEFTGNENALPGRILLLDGEGKVRYFHDEGYSVGSLTRLQDALKSLGQ